MLTELPDKFQRIGIGAEHGGYELKEYLAGKLREAGHQVVDFGDDRPKEEYEYPDFIVPVARAVAAGTVDRGVGICGSGVGASICANKVAGVRACLIHENFSAHQGVEDDDLNMICSGVSWSDTPSPGNWCRHFSLRNSAARSGIFADWQKWQIWKPSHERRTFMITMKHTPAITCLFLDIGGVLLTNGWDHHARRRATKHFKLDWAEMEERHGLNFETHEEDKITFKEYLDRVVFYEKRPFTRAEFRRFMFAQSKPYAEMIELVRNLKAKYGLKIIVVSNESRELNAHRISTFKLDGFVDAFISSCYVRLRKPDADIFKLALDIAQTPARQIVYIENTAMFVQIAEGMGIRGILHTDYQSTHTQLAALGLNMSELVKPRNK